MNKLNKKFISDSLTIISQGPFYDWNIVQSAQILSQWRSIFPKSKIIFSISQSDLLVFEGFGIISNPRLIAVHRNNATFRDALAVIIQSCDVIIMSDAAITLPPVKAGLRESNCNLQIAAAKSALKFVETEYVLRIRNDIIFTDDSFLDFYINNFNLPRGSFSTLKQRVLISEFFTLNPFTFEALPFHYSDWLHFGLTEDVNRLWDVSPYGIVDATYYQRHEYKKDSGLRETSFISRYAVEQYLSFSVFKREFKNIKLDFHNDLSSVDDSMDILVDNFIISDYEKTQIYFEKYQHILKDDNIHTVCVSYNDWKNIIKYRQRRFKLGYKKIFSKGIKIAKSEATGEYDNHLDSEPQTLIHERFFVNIFISILRLILSDRRRKKLLQDPRQFFLDSKNPITRHIGKRYFLF